MNNSVQFALIALGAFAVMGVIYTTVRTLISRHSLYQQIKAQTDRLILKRTVLSNGWGSFDMSNRLEIFKYVPPGKLDKAEKLRTEIEAKLDESIRIKAILLRKKMLEDKAKLLEVKSPVDWPFWLFWQTVYGFYDLLNWSTYPVILAWPSHTMRRLNRRFEYLQGLDREMEAAIKSVRVLIRSSKFLTDQKEKELKEQAEARRKAQEVTQKRLLLEEIRQKLMDAVKFHLNAPAEEILRGSSLLDIEAARRQWRQRLQVIKVEDPNDSELSSRILLRGEELSSFELVSVVEGGPTLSKIQRHAERLAESEKLLHTAQTAFSERIHFSALGTPEAPDSLGKAQKLLVEAAGFWSTLKFERLLDLANATDDLARQAVSDIEDLKRWEDIILGFDKKRADIKENEKALAAYEVVLPQTADWKKAIQTLEKEVPHAWAVYDWKRLNELNKQINDAFTARAQEVNRRLDVEHNKRVARGQPLPEGAKRRGISSSSVPESTASPQGSNGSGSVQGEGSSRNIRYAPDPAHMEPLVSVRSSLGLQMQVRKSMAVNGEYIILNPNNPDESLVWVRSRTSKALLQIAQSLAGSEEYEIVSPNDPKLVALLQSKVSKGS